MASIASGGRHAATIDHHPHARRTNGRIVLRLRIGEGAAQNRVNISAKLHMIASVWKRQNVTAALERLRMQLLIAFAKYEFNDHSSPIIALPGCHEAGSFFRISAICSDDGFQSVSHVLQ